jgi:hypothetical protein
VQTGFYTKRPVTLYSYRVSKFKFPSDDLVFKSGGCGANALSVLTRISPTVIERANKNWGRSHYNDRFMVGFLRQKGYTVIPITKALVSQGKNPLDVGNRIRRDHVLLVSQLYLEDEASWVVLYDGNLMHNFQEAPIYPLEFINRPILTAYLIYHRKWN